MKNHLVGIFCLLSFLIYGQSHVILEANISPDASKIAFVYEGDIWLSDLNGENCRPLVFHEAYENSVVWSPDSESIAYSSEKFGNNDVFVMPARGGKSKQLTFLGTSDVPSSWTRDDHILFTTSRLFKQVERESEIQSVSVEGGTPTRPFDFVGLEPAESPDGNLVAFVMGSCRMERETYTGPANKNIWIYNKKSNAYHQITTHDAQDISPKWTKNGDLYFLSARSGKYNIYKTKPTSTGAAGKIDQVTSKQDFGIYQFSIDATADHIVYESMGQIYLMAKGKTNAIEFDFQVDSKFYDDEVKSYDDNISDYAISPDGKQVALEIRGEIFVKELDNDNRDYVNISNSPSNDYSPQWLNDDKLLFISDRGSRNTIYMATSKDTSEMNLIYTKSMDIQQLPTGDHDVLGFSISPDQSKMVVSRNYKELVLYDIDSLHRFTENKTLLSHWDVPTSVEWSPFSDWIAFSHDDLNFNEEVYLMELSSDRKINVTMHPKSDSSPRFSPDGKKLVFASERNNGDADIWMCWLAKEDWQRTEEDWKRYERLAEKDTTKKSEKLAVDEDEIYMRLVQLSSMPGGESSPHFDSKSEFIYFTNSNTFPRFYSSTKTDIYKVKWNGQDFKNLTDNSTSEGRLQTGKDNKKLYFTAMGKLNEMNMSSDKVEKYNHSVKLRVDFQKDKEQIFKQASFYLNYRFYDPEFHGRDWEMLKETYRPIALKASTKQDFGVLYNRMLGQIDASHMGLYNGETPEDTQRQPSKYLGVEFEYKNDDLFVRKVLQNAPADKSFSQLQVGDKILAVEGQSITKTTNVYQIINEYLDDIVTLEIERNGGKLEVEVRPTGSVSSEKYADWVNNRRDYVDRISQGKLGYVHIQGMNWTSFEEFERGLTAAGQGKQGLVIDVRYNGGGWTTDYLMAVLSPRQHAYTVPRGSMAQPNKNHEAFSDYYPYGERLPLASWNKPAITICNESSYSNAEIFSHAFKTLGRGSLVGMPTFGAVISTGGAGLMDGSYVRLPYRGWYVKETKENMEHGPAVPNFIVPNQPNYKTGKDDQLEKAVEQLLSEINQN